MSDLFEFLLPRSDGAVLLQLSLSVVVSIVVVLHLSRRDRPESAWFAAGLSCLWVAFMAFRTLH